MAQLFNVRNNDQLSGRQLVMGSTIFDSYKSQYLTNTPASDGNTRTFTFSALVKRSRMSTTNVTVYPTIFTGYKDNNEMDYKVNLAVALYRMYMYDEAMEYYEEVKKGKPELVSQLDFIETMGESTPKFDKFD